MWVHIICLSFAMAIDVVVNETARKKSQVQICELECTLSVSFFAIAIDFAVKQTELERSLNLTSAG